MQHNHWNHNNLQFLSEVGPGPYGLKIPPGQKVRMTFKPYSPTHLICVAIYLSVFFYFFC